MDKQNGEKGRNLGGDAVREGVEQVLELVPSKRAHHGNVLHGQNIPDDVHIIPTPASPSLIFLVLVLLDCAHMATAALYLPLLAVSTSPSHFLLCFSPSLHASFLPSGEFLLPSMLWEY